MFEKLKQETDMVYLIAGGGAMFLVDALGLSGMKYVAAIHEEAAGLMAIGDAMYAKRLGFALVTSGPGSTNILTAVAAAWTDSIPLLVISGQAKSETLIGNTGLRTRGVQEIDIIPMVKPITKVASQPVTAVDAMAQLKFMIDACKSGRSGPCWLSVPQDIQVTEIQ